MGLFSLEKRRLRGLQIAASNYVIASYREDRVKLISELTSKTIRGFSHDAAKEELPEPK